MCIICNLDAADRTTGVEKADEFLGAFAEASAAMKRASAAMLACSKLDRRYDKTHKRMVAMRRAWNSLEEQREQHGSVDLPDRTADRNSAADGADLDPA